MDPKDSKKFLAVLTFLLLAVFLAAAQFSHQPNLGFADSAAILALITAVAVGIERVLEAGWTVIGLTRNAWWPFNVIGAQSEQLLKLANDQLSPIYSQVDSAIDRLEGVDVDKARKELQAIKEQIEALMQAAPSGQQVNLVSARALQALEYLDRKYPGVIQHIDIAQQTLYGAADFVATFKENPAKRLVSIYAGAMIGIAIAGLVGLDLFQAILGDPEAAAAPAAGLFPYLGVAVTGLIMGLGSSPTHEVIRVLQEIKKSRKSSNDPAAPEARPTEIRPLTPAPVYQPARPVEPLSAFDALDALATPLEESAPAEPINAQRPLKTFSLSRR